MSLFGSLVSGPQARVNIKLTGVDSRLKKEMSSGKGTTHLLPIYQTHEGVSGTVEIVLAPGKKLEHLGIKIELVGAIEMLNDRTSTYEFTSLVKELETAGVLYSDKQYSFDFATVDKPYDSYTGLNVRLRYFLKVTVTRQYAPNILAEQELVVQSTAEPPPSQSSIKMEVGIEDCLHIEFEYDKQKYHLKDVILGKIYFLLVRIKIKHMELAIIRRESAGTGSNVTNESETLCKFEVMDGAPVKGECIPLRLFLSSIDLTPTYRSVNNRFSVRYYLNLVLVDEEDRRYFKQQEVVFYNKDLG
ncbi:vacuolar protein sorting 26 [Nannochloropsis oceanica]